MLYGLRWMERRSHKVEARRDGARRAKAIWHAISPPHWQFAGWPGLSVETGGPAGMASNGVVHTVQPGENSKLNIFVKTCPIQRTHPVIYGGQERGYACTLQEPPKERLLPRSVTSSTSYGMQRRTLVISVSERRQKQAIACADLHWLEVYIYSAVLLFEELATHRPPTATSLK